MALMLKERRYEINLITVEDPAEQKIFGAHQMPVVNAMNEEQRDEKYTEAYYLLYPEFREKYFKTQEEFRDYAKKTYPRSTGFSYNDIERQGSIYVLVITVIDTNKKIGEEKSQRIVIQENDFNDFVLSFQVL